MAQKAELGLGPGIDSAGCQQKLTEGTLDATSTAEMASLTTDDGYPHFLKVKEKEMSRSPSTGNLVLR